MRKRCQEPFFYSQRLTKASFRCYDHSGYTVIASRLSFFSKLWRLRPKA